MSCLMIGMTPQKCMPKKNACPPEMKEGRKQQPFYRSFVVNFNFTRRPKLVITRNLVRGPLPNPNPFGRPEVVRGSRATPRRA